MTESEMRFDKSGILLDGHNRIAAARKRVESTRILPPPLVAGGQGREDWTSVEADRVGNFTHGFIIGCVIGAAMWVALAYAVWPTLVKIF